MGSDGRMKLVMSNGGWESLRNEQREALSMVIMMVLVMVIMMLMVMVMVMVTE